MESSDPNSPEDNTSTITEPEPNISSQNGERMNESSSTNHQLSLMMAHPTGSLAHPASKTPHLTQLERLALMLSGLLQVTQHYTQATPLRLMFLLTFNTSRTLL